MKAAVEVVSGAVRIFKNPRDELKPFTVAPTNAPEVVELDGEWAVGSASSPGDVQKGDFNITALESGTLRLYHVDGAGELVKVRKGEVRIFRTIEENAYTVSSPHALAPKPDEPWSIASRSS